jgi:UrcA family protein
MHCNISIVRDRVVRTGLIAGLLLLPICAPAVAGDAVDVLTTTVSYDDLNLATSRGAAELYHRITAAAYSVCWPLDHGDIRGQAALKSCIREATQKAVAKVNNAALTAIHMGLQPPAALAVGPSRRE